MRFIPTKFHAPLDYIVGAALIASPWIFGFADDTANVWMPHLIVGVAAVFLGLTTKQQGGYSYKAATAAG